MPKPYLQVEGASIYFEVEGNGPYILFVPGGDGGGAVFTPLRSHLTKHFTIVTYDRRGYCRSKLSGPQDYENRLDVEADDIYKLMRSLTSETFIIFGSSSGGAVSLKYLTKYPNTIYKMFVHEPMTNLDALPDSEYLRIFHTGLYDTYKKEGKDAAIKIYGKKYLNDLDYHMIVCKQLGDKRHNWSFHLEHEVQVYPFYITNTDMIKNNKEKLVLLYGIECVNSFVYRPVKSISEYLDKELHPFPGGHLGYLTETDKFAAEFVRICEKQFVIKNIPKL
ncbi:Alpha/Beta hydrolase protein [Helicostylum pulchrum]|uniref:AB hydrolase-1 domain-containing protein n=1 Tax=Helicostylum pulchrum TaxID=562976 RepID=A0ABP9Y117_9FUNG|nr:Alpha/Beta hydrolase protein [Helicostylum pulchrum]